ncbi:MAG: hypothetical protein ACK5NC_04860 [Vibrio sp.]
MQHIKLSLFAILFVLTGCANFTNENSLQALNAWDKTYNECFEQSTDSTFLFPTDKWYDALPIKDKQQVTLYLYQLKMYQCWGQDAADLKQALTRDNNESLIKLFTGLGVFNKPDGELIKNIDKKQVNRFEKTINVFDLRKVAIQQKFRK